MTLIDTHTHLFDEAFDGDRAEAVERALEAGVEAMICPAIDSTSHEGLFALCRNWPGVCLPTMGLHPTSVNGNPRWREELELVERYLANPHVESFYAVGEVGLDLHWSTEYLAEQREALNRQIELSLRYGLPVVIHVRDAWEQMHELLDGWRGRGVRGVMHAFGGTFEDYLRVKECGDFRFGIGGVVTYKKSPVAALVARIPLEDIVLETDSPYLTPTPRRGERNESAYVGYVCEKVSEIKGVAARRVAEATTAAAREMFGI